MINKSLFIKEEVRKAIKIPQKGKKRALQFKIYNYNDESKKMIFDMYEKKNKNGEESFDLTQEELRLVFNVFTDYLFDIDDLAEIIENPNIYFEEIFHEINMIMCDLVKLFIQEQKEKVEQLNIENELVDLQTMIIDKTNDLKLEDVVNQDGNI
ncbi:MAG: hypothetical protein ACRDD7_03525 [Peptostreptococcaceae bacterium]